MSFSHDYLVSIINYDKETGLLTWTGNKRWTKAGKEAGTTDKKGYRVVMIDGKNYQAHRLAWFYVTQEWPDGNLRSDSTSGFKVVSWHKETKNGGHT